MKLGISSYTYPWALGIKGYSVLKPMTAMQLMQKAVTFDVTQVQIADNLPLHTYPIEELETIKAFANENKLNVEIGSRGLTKDNISRYLEFASYFESPFLRMVIDHEGFEPNKEEIVEIIKDTIPLLKVYGLKLAIENHDRFKAKTFLEIVEQTDPNWVGICLDPINSMGADQSIGEILNVLAPYTLNLHIKDYTIKRKKHNLGFDIQGAVSGKGMMPIEDILNTLKKHNICHSAILELWTPPLGRIEKTIIKEAKWAENSIDYLKKLKNVWNK